MKLQCPHCKTFFQVDENDYAAIAVQVRNAEFESEISRRLAEMQTRYRAEEHSRALQAEKDTQELLARKDRDRLALEMEIAALKSTIAGYDAVKQAEKADIVAAKDKEIAAMRAELMIADKQREVDIANTRTESSRRLSDKDREIAELNSRLEAQKAAAEHHLLELKTSHAIMLKAKDEEIERYRDLKSRLSTKMLGETLERHCHNMFERARSQGQFPDAYFEKDNDASSGTKGDFIFRDYIDGREYISIMFEMKNEDDKTATKHNNADFFAKLDKDRREKQCEYAVLVSTLEADSELYNEGIVDVSYRFPKMLVIRPQFFMAVISLLARTARRGAEQIASLSRDLEIARAQTVDVSRFEQRRDKFVADFGKLVEAHLRKQNDALAGIDKAIEAAEKQADNLRKIRALFEASGKKLIKANEAAENDFTIKKLCHGNPTMRAKFDEARRNASDQE